LARVCVVLACGYVKDGGATTLTPDCRSYEAFEREVERLKGELDAIVERLGEAIDAATAITEG
jgi:hypothetical protein